MCSSRCWSLSPGAPVNVISCLQRFLQLRYGTQLCFIHVGHRPWIIKPGEKIELDLLPDGRGMLTAARQTGTIVGFLGLLAGRTTKVATMEEINAATAQGWAGKE